MRRQALFCNYPAQAEKRANHCGASTVQQCRGEVRNARLRMDTVPRDSSHFFKTFPGRTGKVNG